MVDDSNRETVNRVLSAVYLVGGAAVGSAGLVLLHMGARGSGELVGWAAVGFMLIGMLHIQPVYQGIDSLNEWLRGALRGGSNS